MSLQTNPVFIGLRNIARKFGLTRPLARLRPKKNYEQAFDDALFSTVRSGDVVWDIGANVGYYTKRFAKAVATDGHVVAFEPFPATAARLLEHMQGETNYSLQRMALGSEDGEVTMQAGADALASTSRVVAATDVKDGVAVRIATGDSLLVGKDIPPPTVLKIDTEGFELEVLRGMTDLLGKHDVRAVFVEVHFGLLAERGQSKAPAEIEQRLNAAGFITRWVDPSHIAAERG